MREVDSINIKTIITEAALEISNMPLEHRHGLLNRYVTRVNVTPDLARTLLLDKVWGKCTDLLNERYPETEPLAVERALSELMKRDAVREKIIFKKDSFRLKLTNGQYRAYKHGATGAIWACPWPAERRFEVHICGKRFADFILKFDSEIPRMLDNIPGILETIRKRELHTSKELIERDLKEKILSSLIEQHLQPLGLMVKYTFEEGDMVSMDISQVLKTHINIPLCQLPEKLKGIETILAMLQVEPPKGGKLNEEFDWDNAEFFP